MTLAVPAAVESVKVTLQELDVPEPERLHRGDWKLPATPVSLNVTLPDGVIGFPRFDVSETVTLHVEA